jgi:hypothetical protein
LRPRRVFKELKRIRSFKDFKLRAKAGLRLLGVTQAKSTAMID